MICPGSGERSDRVHSSGALEEAHAEAERLRDAVERLRDLLTWFLVPSLEDGEHEPTTTRDLCWLCDESCAQPNEHRGSCIPRRPRRVSDG